MIFVKEKLNDDIIQQIWKKFYMPGLSELTVVSLEDIDDRVRDIVTSKYGNKIVLRENLFN